MTKWLITGGCGFLGCNIADEAMSRGEEVVVLDNLCRVGSDRNRRWLRARHGEGWRFLGDDVRDEAAVARAVREEKPDAIAHLAGQVAMTSSLRDPRHDFEVNALGSLNVLEATRLHHPEAVVLYSSTNKVYGDLEWVRYEEHETRYRVPDYPNGFDEATPLCFASPYGCSKGAADQYMVDYARIYELRTVVFRHSSMYGGRQFATYDQGWVGWFCSQALRQLGEDQSPFTVSGNGKQVRDLLHVDDMRRLYASVASLSRLPGGAVFNIGGGMSNSLSVLELLALIANINGAKPNVKHIEPRTSDQRVFVADLRHVGHEVGWTPSVSAETGVRRMLAWLGEPDAQERAMANGVSDAGVLDS